MKSKTIRSGKMTDMVRDLTRSPKTVEVIDKELAELAKTWTNLMALREIAAKAHGVTKQPPSMPTTVITQRRHAPYPTEPRKDLEVREGSRAFVVHKILTDAGRPISYRELRERFAETELGRKMGPDDAPYYSGIQALKKNGHCRVYKGHLTTPDVLKQFQADVAAGRVADIEEAPRSRSLWAEGITKYLTERGDWISSKEISEHLGAQPRFAKVKNTYVRTCFMLERLRRLGLAEKSGEGKGTKWRLAMSEADKKLRATEGLPSVARH